ncbi:MAG: hypothetical protein K8W52_12390 [Deltaproteobacteria bacterium]|nr:hypothetical protein [Deltaproteobacteria bacterium]
MALYAYSLFLAREHAAASLLADLERFGLVDGGAMLGVPVEAHEWTNAQQPACPLSVVELALDDAGFERLLRERASALIEWLWRAIAEAGVAHAYIPGGGDFPYHEGGVRTDVAIGEHLGDVVATGTVRIVHPLMLFATRTTAGEWATGAKSMLVEVRPGLGCLLVFGQRDPATGALELFEPATLYERLRDELMGLQAARRSTPS